MSKMHLYIPQLPIINFAEIVESPTKYKIVICLKLFLRILYENIFYIMVFQSHMIYYHNGKYKYNLELLWEDNEKG